MGSQKVVPLGGDVRMAENVIYGNVFILIVVNITAFIVISIKNSLAILFKVSYHSHRRCGI